MSHENQSDANGVPSFAHERCQIRILSNWADAQGMGHVRDLLRMAESEILDREKYIAEIHAGYNWHASPDGIYEVSTGGGG